MAAGSQHFQGRQTTPGDRQRPLEPVAKQPPVDIDTTPTVTLLSLNSSHSPRPLQSAVAELEVVFGMTQGAAARPYISRRAVRALQDPSRVPSILLLDKYLL